MYRKMEWEVTYRSQCNQICLFFLSIFDQYSSVVGRSLQKKKKKPISDQEFLTDPKDPNKKSYL